jgi:molybdopterin-guanine dinucleotide biosynthesis protein B
MKTTSPRVAGIVGYQDSGKTTLTRALARELTRRGYTVAVVKHASHPLDAPGKDTAVLGEAAHQVGFVSAHESALFWKRPLSLEEILPHLEADLVLVEGFKRERTFPKVACLRGLPDDRDLFDGLTLCAVGPADHVPDLAVPILDRDAVERIADLVERHAFKLPGLDCGECGHELCFGLARAIVAGTAGTEDCPPYTRS